MASEIPRESSPEKNVSPNAPNSEWYGSSDNNDWNQFDESGGDDLDCNTAALTSTKDDVSKPSLSDPPNDISWHDGLISEVAEDQKDKFLQRYQATTDCDLVKVPPILRPCDHPAWNGGQNCENAQDNTERFRSFHLNNRNTKLDNATHQHVCGLQASVFAMSTKRWLGVSRQDPRLRLVKYREHLISQAKVAGYDIQTDFQLELTTESTDRQHLGDAVAPVLQSSHPALTTATEMVENLGKSSRKRRRSSSSSPPSDVNTRAKQARLRAEENLALKRFALNCLNGEDDPHLQLDKGAY